MKEYDLIAIGTGSAMNIVSALINSRPELKVAVIDKDEPGGICLTRGCIPTKILVYPADLIRIIQDVKRFGISVDFKGVDFKAVMERMSKLINPSINAIRRGLSHSDAIDYYNASAQFTGPYTLEVGQETVRGKTILLCTGSKPKIPPIKGLEKIDYHTSDTILGIRKLPGVIAIVGGGYIAAEYGHFFSAMGSKVIIIGRNRQFLPQEEPEVSALAKRELSKHMKIVTNHEVLSAERTMTGKKKLISVDRATGKDVGITADEVLIASGRSSNSDILHPERAGIETDRNGWIKVNAMLETNVPNILAFGDVTGHHLFKHVANHESEVVYRNLLLEKKSTVDYRAIPSAVFTHPEIANVGLREAKAIELYGKENILIGMQKYEDTAKGEAMDVKEYFVKVIVEKGSRKILGAHIIGPHASILIQEIINLMYTTDGSAKPLMSAMHIHPALPEVVQRAFGGMVSVDHYHHMMSGGHH